MIRKACLKAIILLRLLAKPYHSPKPLLINKHLQLKTLALNPLSKAANTMKLNLTRSSKRLYKHGGMPLKIVANNPKSRWHSMMKRQRATSLKWKLQKEPLFKHKLTSPKEFPKRNRVGIATNYIFQPTKQWSLRIVAILNKSNVTARNIASKNISY